MDRTELKKTIKDSLTIYDLLPNVDRKARLIKCPIPGHEDKNPSFSVFANGKLAKCQSQCAGLGNLDVIGLYQRIHGGSFLDALKALAQMAGVPFPENGNGNGRNEGASTPKPLNITHELPQTALDYLRGRGLTDATIKRFKLGYVKIYGKDGITIPICQRLRENV